MTMTITLNETHLAMIAKLVNFAEDENGVLYIEDVKGNVMYNVDGNVGGSVCGDVGGDVWGDVMGNVEGEILGDVNETALGHISGA